MEDLSFSTPIGKVVGRRYGTESGIPILALHGWLDNLESLDSLLRELGTLRPVSAVALDFPGHGHSDPIPPGVAYHVPDYFPSLLTVLDALGWKKCHLLGHSLGGAVSSCLAAAFPERFHSVMSLDALGLLSGAVEDTVKRLKDFSEEFLQAQKKNPPVYPTPDKAIQLRMQATPMPLEGTTAIVKRNLMPLAGGWTWRSDRRLRLPTPQRFTEPEIWEILSKIECPFLLVTATQGLLKHLPTLPERKAKVKHLSEIELKGGHHFHLEDPKSVAKILHSFLSTLQA